MLRHLHTSIEPAVFRFMHFFLAALVISSPASVFAKGEVVGMSFNERHVADLEKTIAYYQVLDFELVSGPGEWKVDDTVNRLGGLEGVESRSAVMKVQSSVSDVPYGFILREFRGIDRQDWRGLASFDLFSGHMDLTVLDDCRPSLDKLEAAGMLVTPNNNTLPAAGDDDGPIRFIFIQDPDGWYVELFAKMPRPADAPPLVRDSTATNQNIDRTGHQAGFNHIGLNVVDAHKALPFYEDVLGGDYPPLADHGPAAEGERPRMTILHGWFPQAGADQSLRLELLQFPQNDGKQAPDMQYGDIGLNIVGLQVNDIEDLYKRVVDAGARTVSDGIVQTVEGKVVTIRDPDIGGYLMLWESAR